MIGIVGTADPADRSVTRMSGFIMGELGKLFDALKARGVAEIAIIGAMARPEFADLRLDWGAVKRLASSRRCFAAATITCSTGVARIFESEGVRVVGRA